MNEKQTELAIILNEIYTQTKQYQDIDVLKLDPETLDQMHKEKLEYIRQFLNVKLMSTVRFGNESTADVIRKKIEIFEDMG